MTSWRERSKEERALLNPAFCSLLLWSAAQGYRRVDENGLSFEETFLILPIVLHRTTREALPRDTRTSLAVWVHSNPLAPRHIATRARLLVGTTREAICFGGARGLMGFDAGRLQANDNWRRSINRLVRNSSDEVDLCVRRSALVGKWFAQTGSGSTVLALLGVRP